MQRAMGISIHTGWGACVVVGGSQTNPEIVANEVLRILGDAERFCFHRAAEMKLADAEEWIARTRQKALANARRALAPLVAKQVRVCAIVAKDGEIGNLEHVLASHPRLHSAEGCLLSRRLSRRLRDSGPGRSAVVAGPRHARQACGSALGT